MGIAQDVLMVGHSDDAKQWYAAMDTFALMSSVEQMPVSVLEAMSAGLPVICSDVGDCREMIGEQPIPIIPPADRGEHFAQVLRTVAADPALRAAAGRSNRDRCVREYDVDLMIRRYRQLYQQALESTDCTLSR
jgi:glycosyltransferase involved in cell wall biosynthesis